MTQPPGTVRNRPAPDRDALDRAVARVRAYHQASKHHLQGYARGPATLDWAAQPDPFRRFESTQQLPLPLLRDDPDADYSRLYLPADAPRAIAPRPMDLTGIAALLELSLGLSAWKQYGTDRWSLRINPSSGNLHPTEAYVLAAGIPGLAADVHHYQVHDHALERRCEFAPKTPTNPVSHFFLGLSSVHWREAWKYGERAYRYCQLDIGHALAAIRYAAALLGWQVDLLLEEADAELATLLGLDREQDFHSGEHEQADVLLCIKHPEAARSAPELRSALDGLAAAAFAGHWSGQANVLDPRHLYQWPAIDDVAEACQKPTTPMPAAEFPARTPLAETASQDNAAGIIRHRRSAQAFDGNTGISLESFHHMLDALLPRPDCAPLDHWPYCLIHPVIFVHRVEDLPNGLYALVRQPNAKQRLQSRLRTEFDWQRPPHCPDTLPLYHLVSANARNAAATLACHQAIAADGAFSLAMLAEFDRALQLGPWAYRYLFWEAGMLGQILYLEAEAAGLRGTGIGCFFDDGLHDTLGLKDTALQDVYHFTVGGPVIDHRLTTLPPYSHLQHR